MKTGYTALFYKYEGWWIARVAEVPGVNTQGKTLKEARANLKDALLGILEVNRELTLTSRCRRNSSRTSLTARAGGS